MHDFQYGEILKTSWKKMKANYGMLLAISSIVMVIAFGFAYFVKIFGEYGPMGKVFGQIIALAVNIFLSIGFIRCVLDVADDKGIELSTLFSGGDVFLNFFIAHIAYSLLCLLGMLLFIIPGIFWSLKYFFVTYLIADRGVGMQEAFSLSGQMTDGYKWKLLGLMCLTGLINFGGILCLGFGLLVTIPWTTMAVPIAFRVLSPQSTSVSENNPLAS